MAPPREEGSLKTRVRSTVATPTYSTVSQSRRRRKGRRAGIEVSRTCAAAKWPSARGTTLAAAAPSALWPPSLPLRPPRRRMSRPLT